MTEEEVVVLLGMMRGAWGHGPSPERAEDFAFALRTWWGGLKQYPFDDAIDALELMINGGQTRYPNLVNMIEGIQALRRARVLAQPREVEMGGIPVWDERAQHALHHGYVTEMMRLHGLTREQAEQRARESEVLRPWLTPTT